MVLQKGEVIEASLNPGDILFRKGWMAADADDLVPHFLQKSQEIAADVTRGASQ